MFTSPHPSSPWATLGPSSFIYDASPAASASSSVWSDDEDANEAVAVPTLAFFKPIFQARAEVDYFTFQPHGVRSPYLPDSYGQLEEEALFEFDEEELASGDDDARSVISSSSTSIQWDATPSEAFEHDDADDELVTPVFIERVSVFDLSAPALSAPALSASLSSASSSSSSSSSVAWLRTPPASLSVSLPKHVAPSMSIATAVGSLISSRWQEKAVHADTPHPDVVESPGATAALFNWRRE